MANRDININASLEKTTATGPGPLQVPTLNLDKFSLPQMPDPRYQQQMMAMQRPQYRGPSPEQMAVYQHLGNTGGGGGGMLRSAPPPPSIGPGGVPYGMVPTYVTPSHGFNMGGGMRPATGNEPGAVFAGYVPQGAMPEQVQVATIPRGGFPTAHLSSGDTGQAEASATPGPITKATIDNQLNAMMVGQNPITPQERLRLWEVMRSQIT